MKKLLLLIVSIVIMIILLGCSFKGQYVWGQYPMRRFKYEKKQSNKNLNKLIRNFYEAKSVSKWAKYPDAPSLNCELAYYLYLNGENEEAMKYFDLEKELFPRSVKFVDLLIIELEKSGGLNNEE